MTSKQWKFVQWQPRNQGRKTDELEIEFNEERKNQST